MATKGPSFVERDPVPEKKRKRSAVKQVYLLLKKFILAFAAVGAAIFFYLPFGVQLLMACGAVAIAAIIYLPRPVRHRWEVKFMVAQGWTFEMWTYYLWKHNFSVDPVYWHRALFITVISSLASYSWRPRERKEYPEEEIRASQIKQPPIFILGHFRSGTSFLHELISKDPRFVAPTVYQCFAPHVFLSREDDINKSFGNLKIQRPMDSLRVKMESPQEDEFGLVNLCGLSPYMSAIFPRIAKDKYQKYLTFKQATAEEVQTWKDTVMYFYKKVLFKKQDKRLILKSPAHTARLKLMHELFPDAKFVHISRNPYEIYQSTCKLFLDLLITWNLQYFDYHSLPEGARHACDTVLHRQVLQLFGDMYDSFFEDREALKLGKGQLTYVKYEDLMQSPTQVVRKIYEDLSLGKFDELEPQLRKDEENAKNFRVNKHKELDPRVAEDVRERMGHYFREFGYSEENNDVLSPPARKAPPS